MASIHPAQYRESIRLHGYDYSQAGAYFVTICTQDRASLFGQIVNGEMIANEAGAMIGRRWDELPSRFAVVNLDAIVIMPNHIHGILILNGPGADAGPQGGRPQRLRRRRRVAPTENGTRPHSGPAVAQRAPTLGEVVGWFKTVVTTDYIRGVRQRGWRPFSKRLFQRDYFDHIIRNNRELDAVRAYIANNPANWAMDLDNTQNDNRLTAPKIVDDYLRDVMMK